MKCIALLESQPGTPSSASSKPSSPARNFPWPATWPSVGHRLLHRFLNPKLGEHHAEFIPTLVAALNAPLTHFSNGATSRPSLSTPLRQASNLLQATGRLEEAESVFRRALAIDERKLRADHPTIAVRLGNLAFLLRVTGRLFS
jgi:hypothetical protein